MSEALTINEMLKIVKGYRDATDDGMDQLALIILEVNKCPHKEIRDSFLETLSPCVKQLRKEGDLILAAGINAATSWEGHLKNGMENL